MLVRCMKETSNFIVDETDEFFKEHFEIVG